MHFPTFAHHGTYLKNRSLQVFCGVALCCTHHVLEMLLWDTAQKCCTQGCTEPAWGRPKENMSLVPFTFTVYFVVCFRMFMLV